MSVLGGFTERTECEMRTQDTENDKLKTLVLLKNVNDMVTITSPVLCRWVNILKLSFSRLGLAHIVCICWRTKCLLLLSSYSHHQVT